VGDHPFDLDHDVGDRVLHNAAGSLVPGNGGADMVWASPLAWSGNFLLRLAVCQGKDLFTEGR
jgi:hypothetical protein